MGQFVVTPQWVGTFETAQRTLIQNSWDRVLKNLVWDKFMQVQPSSTLKELYFWLLETAKITDQGAGGQKSFDSLAATFFEIDNSDSGSGLLLTRNEIEDNRMMRPGMSQAGPTLDYAANWARQIGGAAAYWPQEKMFALIAAGETTHGYDGVNYFATNHPVNPYDTGAGNYSNLHAALPIDVTNAASLNVAAANFAKAVASVRALKQPNGKPRMLRVKAALCGPTEEKRITEILATKFFGQDGSTENVVSRYGIEPVVCDELTTAGEYYLACEMLTGEGGGLIFQDRSPYVLTSYTPETQAQLQMRKEFLWSFDGRNAAAYGHPYLFHKVKPT